MRQTAVDYLFQELWQAPKDKWMWKMILNQAKEMEKEQIIDVFKDAYDFGYYDNYNYSAEQYYKETYENES